MRHNPRKLGHRTAGPYKVLQTHVNGTLTTELKPDISERINSVESYPIRSNTANFPSDVTHPPRRGIVR